MAPHDDKYIVFKREKWEAIAADKGTATRNEFLRAVVDDAVVIRRQDEFAPPALDSYANSIRIAIEVAGRSDEAIANGFPQRMQHIADYFAEQAAASWDTNRKLPD